MEGTTTISNEEYLRLKKLEESIDSMASIKTGFMSGITFLNETDTIVELANIAEERKKQFLDLEKKYLEKTAT